MKKSFLILCAMVMGILVQAQITYEHSYLGKVSMFYAKLDVEGYKYIGVDTLTKNVQLFNTDHTLWKTIPITQPANCKGVGLNASVTSEHLFNSDDKIEVAISFSIKDSIGWAYDTKIINEDGVVIFDFPNIGGVSIYNIAGVWKLFGSFYQHSPTFTQTYTHTDVYGLPGTYSGMRVMNTNSTVTETELYPNPVENSAVLVYNLPEGTHNAQLSIYNSAGRMVRQSEITDQFDNVLIEKNGLPTGVYIYKIANNEGVLDTKQFEVR